MLHIVSPTRFYMFMAWRTPGSSVSPKSSRSAPREVQQLESVWLLSTDTSSKCMCIQSCTNSLFVVMSLPLHNPLFRRTSKALVASWIGKPWVCVCVSPCSGRPIAWISCWFKGAKQMRRAPHPWGVVSCLRNAFALIFQNQNYSRRAFLEKWFGASMYFVLECSACAGFRHCTAHRTSRCQALYLPETQKLRRIWLIVLIDPCHGDELANTLEVSLSFSWCPFWYLYP